MSVSFSSAYGCWIWTCMAGHLAFDFESQAEAHADYLKHKCPFA